MPIQNECRFCNSVLTFFSVASVFGQSAQYDLCENCGSVQITSAPWLEKAHKGGIVETDTGAAGRSQDFARNFTAFMKNQGESKLAGIDFGGGSGLLTRILRDRGFDCKSFDPYANQFFASGFTSQERDLQLASDFMLAVECIEHLRNPIELFGEIVKNKRYFCFTTELVSTPPPNPSKENPWWYYSQESGQHITFASNQGIQSFLTRLGFSNYIRLGGIHIFTNERIHFLNKVFAKWPRLWLLYSIYFDLKYRQKYSLADGDSAYLKALLRSK